MRPWDRLGDLDEFAWGCWDRAPLHRRADPDFDPSSVISLRELDRLICSRHTDARLLHRGAYVDEAAHRERGLRREDERTWLSDPGAVVERFRAGATIVLRSAHEIWPPLEELATALASLLGDDVGAALFVTPGGSLTDWHADEGHLFVVQLHGTRWWRVENPSEAPRRRAGSPLDATLRPGDVLYVPRGFPHRVEATGGAAVHASFYLAPPTWADLAKEALVDRIDALPNAVLGRSPANPALGPRSRARWTESLDEVLVELEQVVGDLRAASSSLEADSMTSRRRRRHGRAAPDPDALLDAYAAADEGPEPATRQSTTPRPITDADRAAILGALPGIRLGEVLGTGAGGCVVAAVDQASGRRIALKVLAGENLRTAYAPERLRAEAEVLTSCRHPNLVDGIGFHELDDLLVLVMERVDGLSVLQRHQAQALTIAETCNVALTAAKALQCVHDAGFLHGDVKHQNVLFDPDGRHRVIDFGLARRFPVVTDRHIAGSPGYLAPEAIVPGGVQGPAIDVYALGVMTYELLAGHPPYVGTRDPKQVMRLHVEATPIPLRALAPHVPHELGELVMAAFHRRVEDRIGSAQELADGLVALGAATASDDVDEQVRPAEATRPRDVASSRRS